MSVEKIHTRIIECSKCVRLITWCKKIEKEKRKSFAQDTYWGKPVPAFGDPNAQILILGLAPAAHGANRTGRMFTGDNSGLWLYRALFENNLSNLPESKHKTDSLKLSNVYITATVHCAPPDNKPTTEEIQTCMNYFREELNVMKNVKVIIALGSIAWNTFFQIAKEKGWASRKEKFGHGVVIEVGPYKLIGSYHPSQQNTFTKRLTHDMFDSIFKQAKQLLK
ncbi:MAG: uracil-DNA glycosylase [Proteobacteria bacterium]|jgi:uracil-DNA glycosylase family 4|nr:uracil-DNA glycosylase [Pseudomonadota bacterium]